MRGERDPGQALVEARVLRVADCEVLSGREDHFRAVQERVWLPGMASADGMLGGVFSQIGDRRYLTTTGWRDRRLHERYVREQVPALRATADTAGDLRAIRGYAVTISPVWKVVGRLTGPDR